MPTPPLAIIQARMGASRLPGKVLKEIQGRPMLSWVVERARRAACLAERAAPASPGSVWVATTTAPADDPIAAYCAEQGYPVYRGSEQDVLDRYYQTARAAERAAPAPLIKGGRGDSPAIIRITADCPFIDPALIDDTYQQFLAAGVDFAANRLPPPWKRTYPIGLDVEICTFAALERAWQETTEKFHREHVMPYLYAGVPVDADKIRPDGVRPASSVPASAAGFTVLLTQAPADYGALRWTVDTPEDLELARRIAALMSPRDDFGWLELVSLFETHPELAQINATITQKDVRVTDDRKNP